MSARTWRWALAGALLVVYGPHILWATWVYEDGAWLWNMQAAEVVPPIWAWRGVSRALWWLQVQIAPYPQTVHAVSLALHLVVVWVSSRLASAFQLTDVARRIVITLVALHPLTIEAVSYAAQQGELVAAIGVLSACLLAAGQWWRWQVVAGIVGCLALGCLGKESAVVGLGLVPLVILAVDRQDRPRWAPLWMPAAVISWGVSFVVWRMGPWLIDIGEAPGGVTVAAGDWISAQSAAIVRAFGQLLFIGPFTVDYDVDAMPQLWRWLSVTVLEVLALVGLLTWSRSRITACGLLALLIVVAPRLVIQTPRSYFNEHQAYLLVPWFALMVGHLYDRWRARRADYTFITGYRPWRTQL